ncbi:carboxymuconolactone decarboxylase family protein [Algoriphagus halophytocola]|uniref:Carboxymuconolactone decarboxylase family protein n=1 Tax=Algoriphagus halophytocola TaxID=2991499 RepID=A0ABY6MJM0_9BACT|nr:MULTISPECIES: carboxymuconolactone decarboxylase family protein [unclassified Algoriphagus]UZD22876.1 carboxymuconolactone decarboxylase family protein [Algoriphagus sp. TR-M5]WBL44143.1 carboxymuconolactone decarboxylase family protein [Algoriphagus sp. TR-M9]
MESRLQIDEVEPKGYQSLFGIEKYLQQAELTSTHKELIKIRASQLNKCAFCIDMHTKEALKQGEKIQRVLLLNAWRETDLFTPEEKTLLQITEEVTLISENGLSRESYHQGLRTFGENYLAQVILAIIAINAWNRLAVSTNKPIP